jgi:hypothetical protein
MKKTKLTFLLTIVWMFSFLALTSIASASVLQDSVYGRLNNVAGQTGIDTGASVDFRLAAVIVVRYILSFVGLIFFLMIVYGGFTYLFAGGNDVATGRAIHILQNAIIGLLIILISFSLSTFIITRLQRATLGQVDDRTSTYGAGCVGRYDANGVFIGCGGYQY